MIRKFYRVQSAETTDQNTPVAGGLFDLHMGTIDRRYPCLTCGQREWYCPGHMGYIELCKPCFNPLMLDFVVQVLRSICPDCSALLIPEHEIKERSLRWVSNEVTSKAAYRFCTVGHPNVTWSDEEEEEQVVVDPNESLTQKPEGACGCGAHRAEYTKIDGLHIRAIMFEMKPAEPEEAEEEGGRKRRKKKTLAEQFVKREVQITAEKAYKILRKITQEHAELMGFGPDQHPSWLIWTAFPVLSPSERPSIQMNAQRRGEDDLTCAWFNIIKANQELEKAIASGCHPSQLSPKYELLQWRVGSAISNDLQRQPQAKQRSGRVQHGVTQGLKGKEGHVRGSQMGKRVDQSGRSVITGDPNLSVSEVGLPKEMAMILTKRITVTAENIDECWQRVMKGPFEYGGANAIIKNIKGREYVVDLKMARDRSEITLRKGQQIEVHLEDGDYILFNRQPTLHRLGMMAHRVKVVDTLTLRMNESTTPPYNADFDGKLVAVNNRLPSWLRLIPRRENSVIVAYDLTC